MSLYSVNTVLPLDECYYAVIVLCADGDRHKSIKRKVKLANIIGLEVVEVVDRRIKQWLQHNYKGIKIKTIPCCLVACDGKPTKVVSIDQLDYIIQKIKQLSDY